VAGPDSGIALGAPTAFADEGKNESGERERREGRDEDRDKEWKHDKDYRERGSHDDDRRRRQSYFHEHGYTRIPKGHLPPPGECRIWYPDRPAGHQPPPFNCGQARGQVEPGGWLIAPGP
jgi:hypothetical protein